VDCSKRASLSVRLRFLTFGSSQIPHLWDGSFCVKHADVIVDARIRDLILVRLEPVVLGLPCGLTIGLHSKAMVLNRVKSEAIIVVMILIQDIQ